MADTEPAIDVEFVEIHDGDSVEAIDLYPTDYDESDSLEVMAERIMDIVMEGSIFTEAGRTDIHNKIGEYLYEQHDPQGTWAKL